MSRGQLPRDRLSFPRMKYRAANRRQWRQMQHAFDLAVSQDPAGFAAGIANYLADRAGIPSEMRPAPLRAFLPTRRV